jgi:acyl-CoA synthetase (AMP-forming)/AMP-acid ligase II
VSASTQRAPLLCKSSPISSKEAPKTASTTIFESKLEKPRLPSSDVFNYVFHHGRRAYPWNRVIYRVDGTEETLTLVQLEAKSRRFAVAIRDQFGIQANDVVSIYAKDKVGCISRQYEIRHFQLLNLLSCLI